MTTNIFNPRTKQATALTRHRRQLKRSGMVRVEIAATEADAKLIKNVGKFLKVGSPGADRLRSQMRAALAPVSGKTLLDLLACDVPDEPFDTYLRRPKGKWRSIKL